MQRRAGHRQLLKFLILAAGLGGAGLASPAWAQDAPVTNCDRLAAHPADPARVAPGVQWDLMDHRAAIRACEEAVARYPGVTRLSYQLGRALLRANRRDEGMPYLFDAAEKNYVIAFANIGGTYQFDLGNYAEALKWYRRGADLGDVSAQTHLAEMYQEGWGVERNLAEALRWYTPSAEAGYPLSEYKIGAIYEAGDHNVKRDPEKAVAYYLRAANKGFARAQNDLGYAYERGFGVHRDPKQAMTWYLRAAEQGWALAQINAARLYENGYGTEKDRQEAFYWYRLASEARIENLRRTATQGVQRLRKRLKANEVAEVDARINIWQAVTQEQSAASIQLAAAPQTEAPQQSAAVDSAYTPPGAAQATVAKPTTIDTAYRPPGAEAGATSVDPSYKPPAAPQPAGSTAPAATAAAAPPDIEPMNAAYMAVSNANVRSAPDEAAPRIGGLQAGELITVIGKVVGRDWMMASYANNRLGYVHTDLVRPMPKLAASPATAPQVAALPPAESKSVPLDIDFGRYHALVIGNNDYVQLPKLKTAVNDAKAVAEILQRDYGFKVELLLNATRHDVLTALAALRASLTERDNLLVYYAGHGVLDKDAGRGYWLPVDAERQSPANWISNADLTDMVKASTAMHVLVIADSCYSGTLVRNAAVRVKTGAERAAWLQRIATKRSRSAMVSGGLEPVLDSGGGGHSVFAKAFLDTLRENAGAIEGMEVYARLRRPVVVNSEQTPEYSDIRQAGHDGGDFIFVRQGAASSGN